MSSYVNILKDSKCRPNFCNIHILIQSAMHCMYSLKLKGSAKGACARSNLDEAPRGNEEDFETFPSIPDSFESWREQAK